jgi:hypothetical protein
MRSRNRLIPLLLLIRGYAVIDEPELVRNSRRRIDSFAFGDINN